MRTGLDCIAFGRQLHWTLFLREKPGRRCHGRVTQRETHSTEAPRGD